MFYRFVFPFYTSFIDTSTSGTYICMLNNLFISYHQLAVWRWSHRLNVKLTSFLSRILMAQDPKARHVMFNSFDKLPALEDL